jgi:hypothetical protein
MFKTNDSKRRNLFAAIVAGLTLVGALTQTARADIRQVRTALIGDRGFIFHFSATGAPGAILVVQQVNDSGAFTGKYYPYSGAQPASPNVTGTITFVGDAGATQAIRVMFTVTQHNASGLVASVETFDGALQLGTEGTSGIPPARQRASFMAGTYSTGGRTVPGPRTAPGPYPFCATVEEIPG